MNDLVSTGAGWQSEYQSGESVHWLRPGEKFALIGFPIRTAGQLLCGDLEPTQRVLTRGEFWVADHWLEWLGSLQAENIADCNLFICVVGPSKEPGVINAEDELLRQRVSNWFTGLTLTSKFSTSDALFLASGGHVDGRLDMSSFGRIVPPAPTVIGSDVALASQDLVQGACLADRLEAVRSLAGGRNWRLSRCLRIYQDGRTDPDVMERIHQFTRCIEGLVAPSAGETLRQFKSRTELFVGPRHHDLMGRLYRVRSDVEHLHENRHLEEFNRSKRLELASLEAVGEWVARSSLSRILETPALFEVFGNIDTLHEFWAQDGSIRRQLWGEPVDPTLPLRSLALDRITDRDLGRFD